MERVSQKYKWSKSLMPDLLALAVRVICYRCQHWFCGSLAKNIVTFLNEQISFIFANITFQWTGSSRTSCFIILISDVYDQLFDHLYLRFLCSWCVRAGDKFRFKVEEVLANLCIFEPTLVSSWSNNIKSLRLDGQWAELNKSST